MIGYSIFKYVGAVMPSMWPKCVFMWYAQPAWPCPMVSPINMDLQSHADQTDKHHHKILWNWQENDGCRWISATSYKRHMW